MQEYEDKAATHDTETGRSDHRGLNHVFLIQT